MKRLSFIAGRAYRDAKPGVRVLRAALLTLALLVLTVGPAVPGGGTRAGFGTGVQAAPVGQGFNLDASDLRFILKQIKIAEAHAAGGALLGPGPNQVNEPRLPFGLRTVDGSLNHLLPGQEQFGAADQLFPRMTVPVFRPAESWAIDPDGPGPIQAGDPTSYAQTKGLVNDSQPRTISNLIVDQTATNPAAVAAAGPDCVTPGETCFIPNVAPDVGLSAPFNALFTFFGQFFDHGLDLVPKSGGAVFMPLQPDDPLYVPGSPTNFMILTRAANQPGPDGIVGDDPSTPLVDESADDIHEAVNLTTPFVDQNQTYTSHPSHQVFLREYALDALGKPAPTGRLIDGAIPGNIGNWAEVKAQAATMLGIQLVDQDVFNVPLLATDPYGHFLPGPNGYPLLAMPAGVMVEGNPAAPVTTAGSRKTDHGFLDDIAHHAVPDTWDHDGNPATPKVPKTPDADPGTTDDHNPGTYDDEMLNAHFITGDGRGNENIALTSVHTVFHAEHNRLRDNIDGLIHSLLTAAEIAEWELQAPLPPAGSGWGYGERLFQAARFVTEMQYQHLVFEEFARKLVPLINPFIVDGINFQSDTNPAIPAEFAHAVYRLGHSMLVEMIARTNADGSTNDIALLDAFLNPLAFNDGGPAGPLNAAQAVGSIVQGLTRQVGNEIDEFVTDVVRNRLLGLPLDLPSINLARGRSEGIPPLNAVRRQLYLASGRPELVPYESWADFSFELKHRESLVNFIAAYGTHPSIMTLDPDGAGPILAGSLKAKRMAADQIVNGTTLPGPNGVVGDDPLTVVNESLDDLLAPVDRLDFMLGTGAWVNSGGVTTTGLDTVDLWIGGLAEKQAVFGSLLGSTFNFVFEMTLENLQNADRFYYLERLDGLNLVVQLEGNSLAELIMRNSSAVGLPADAFSRADLVLNLANLGTSGPILDDPTTVEDESTMTDLVRMPDGTIRYSGVLHVIWNGRDTADGDRIKSSEGDDTLRGNGGNDIMEGGAGNDQFIGGDGDDILTDTFGDDVLKGGDGNDVLSSGAGFDLNQGGRGKDYIIGGSDGTETFGGPGNDFIYAGEAEDTVFGDEGDDWIEGGAQLDLLQGDGGNQFQNDPNGGHDVIIGGLGDDDYDSDGGDDIMVADVLGTERFEGMLGFDWVTHRGDPLPADADMLVTGLLAVAPDINELRDRFDLVEGLSGWNNNDMLRGDNRTAVDLANGALGTVPDGHVLTAAGIARITGLAALLPAGATEFRGGNILLGGGGSDLIEGRGGDDIIDGDAWLNVQLQAPNPATADPADTQLVDSMLQLRADVLAGRINPGDIFIVRSIVMTGALPTDVDTAVFSGPRAEYTITVNPNGSVTVNHNGGLDGVDTLWHIEQLAFADGTIPAPHNSPASGTVTISDTTPAEDQTLTVTSALVDPEGINGATLVYHWQAETAPAVWSEVGTGTSFVPSDPVVGRRLRVVATFQDNAGVAESVVSAPTAPVSAVNDPATGAPVISDTTPEVNAQVSVDTSTIADVDGLPAAFTYQWLANGVPIAGATSTTFTPTAAQAGQQLSVTVSFTDNQGFAESLTSALTAPVAFGTGPIASLAAGLDFGTSRVNTTRTKPLTVTNTGTSPLVIGSVTTSGAPFSATLGNCPASLAPGRKCNLQVSFQAPAAQVFLGTLTLTSNAGNSPTVVALTGRGR